MDATQAQMDIEKKDEQVPSKEEVQVHDEENIEDDSSEESESEQIPDGETEGTRFEYPSDDETVQTTGIQSTARICQAAISFNPAVGKWHCNICDKYIPSARCPRSGLLGSHRKLP